MISILTLLALVFIPAAVAFVLVRISIWTKDRAAERRLRNAFAREAGYKNYADYLKNSPWTDSGIDEKDGYNLWLVQRGHAL